MKVVAFERSVQGTGASRRLRNSGKTPGIIYGGKDASNLSLSWITTHCSMLSARKHSTHPSWISKSAARHKKCCCAIIRCIRLSL
jgi:ribosomal protein L25 (general stress protein Ctc)